MKLAAASVSVSKYVLSSLTVAPNFLFLTCFASRAQTPQPLLFAVSTSNNQHSASTFLRDDVAGTLTLLQTSAPFKNPCVPSAIDAKGRFLFGMCGAGLSLYTYDSATGTIAEVAASPFAASTGDQSNLIVAESSGQYVYLLKINPAGSPNSQSLFLDTFQIDSSTPRLDPDFFANSTRAWFLCRIRRRSQSVRHNDFSEPERHLRLLLHRPPLQHYLRSHYRTREAQSGRRTEHRLQRAQHGHQPYRQISRHRFRPGDRLVFCLRNRLERFHAHESHLPVTGISPARSWAVSSSKFSSNCCPQKHFV